MMGAKTGGGFCPKCKDHVVTQKNTPNHILHLLLSFFTGGLWVVIWLIVIFANLGGWRCTVCGYKV